MEIPKAVSSLPKWAPSRLASLGVLAVGLVILWRLQFMIPTLWESDGYYHMQMSKVVSSEGFVDRLHWTRYSIFAEHFADKDLLYHVLLVPFTLGADAVFGTKLAAFIFAAALFLLFSWLVRCLGEERSAPFFLILFFLSDHFLSALCRSRPMIPAIGLMILGLWFMMRRNTWGVFWTVFLYGLLHLTAPLMVVLAVMVEGVRILEHRANPSDENRASWKPVAAAAGALTLSFLLHPNFPDNLRVVWLNLFMVPYYAAKGGVLELGAEFFPLLTSEYLLGYGVLLVTGITLVLVSMFRPFKTRFETKVLFVCGIPFLIGSLLSQRYIIHGFPILILWAASYARDISQAEWAGIVPPVLKKASWICAGILILQTAMAAKDRMMMRAQSEYFINSHYERMGAAMKANVPAGEIIFHSNWSDSQYFIGTNPQNDYFVTLDPIYMYAWNPDLYKLYRDIAFGRNPDPYSALKNIFNVRFGYAGKNYFSGLIEQVRRDPRFEVLVEDQIGLLFKLKEPLLTQ